MTKFRIGGSGPNGRGLGNIVGIAKRFESAGEIYETNVYSEMEILRHLEKKSLVTEIVDTEIARRDKLQIMSWKELVSLGSKLGVFKAGINKAELIKKIIDSL